MRQMAQESISQKIFSGHLDEQWTGKWRRIPVNNFEG
jgi:hypothetical protein